MMRVLTLSLAALLLSAPYSVAEPVSLADAVRQAIATSPDIESAEASLDSAAADLDQARGQRGISVGAQAQLGVSETDFTTGSISQVPRQVGLQAELPLYTSGSLASAESAARHGIRSAEETIAGTKESVALNTVEAYTRLWLALQALDVTENEVETLQLRNDETASRLDQGLATRTDTALAASRLASARARLASREADLAAARSRFERLTGLDEATPLNPETVDLTLPPTQAEALAMARQNNPGLAAARAQLEAARSRENQVRGEFGPKVSLKARASTGEDVYFFFEDQITDAGAFVSVEVPLFTNGVKPAAINKAGAGRRAAAAALRSRQLELDDTVRALWYRVIAQRQALEAASSAETAAEIATDGARREQDLGLRTLVDMLDAEDDYRRAAIARRSAEADLLVAKARLLAMLSGLESQLVEGF
ncbi:TolC family protein [Henriciella sp.]|uniref:TolC family protein n=1 Tax=Henriciella sp. TaxID=1968823 RepID=UPI00261B09CF|nr:TolC family protein [Henriciella sp.]